MIIGEFITLLADDVYAALSFLLGGKKSLNIMKSS
jgi:hypothetical protein